MKWRCPQCGRPHAANDPPCDDCGYQRLERAVVPAGVERDAPGFQWVCPDCGKSQPKNSPPCSRCGSMSFERRSLDYEEEFDTGQPGRFDGLLPVAGVLAVVVVGFVLLGTGVVSLPGQGPPTVDDPPGFADAAGGVGFDTAEERMLAAFNEERDAAGEPSLRSDDTLTAMATFWNQRAVTDDYEDREVAGSLGEFDATCAEGPTIYSPYTSERTTGTVADYDSAEELAAALASPLRSSPEGREMLLDADGRVGIDIHAGPDGVVYVTTVVC
ncbi:hypothetical protein [Halomarina rubra]|uniref:Zinc ribbon domain-containing protein n=1 Tax=Halomarina rubra TaxID=2071873 RepID=A0ABD6ASZ5_9EURY|nr:hypothetical protein [Halomarina rubra]